MTKGRPAPSSSMNRSQQSIAKRPNIGRHFDDIKKLRMDQNPSQDATLFTYTSGRWLHLDKPQRDARYVKFNFNQLCQKVLSLCPSATSIESCEKVEGGFSKVFIMKMDNGRCVVVKFPMAVVGPAGYVTNSEVATVTYLQRHTRIPIPAVLDWSDDPANPVGYPYIIMEHAGGVSLQELQEHVLGLQWHDLSSYTSALIDVGLARLPPPDHPLPLQQHASYQGSISKHLSLLKTAQAIFPNLITHPSIHSNSTPTLFHPDLHKRNIFVLSKDNPTTITGFIDWQSTSIEPAFEYAHDVPDFARIPAESESDGTSEEYAEISPRHLAYEVGWAIFAPRLGATRHIDERLLRPFSYAHRTWRDGFVPFTTELLRLREGWEELGFQKSSPCPIPALSAEEEAVYKEQLEVYEKMVEFWRDMSGELGVGGDGWVGVERWEGVRRAHARLFEMVMGNMEDERDREDLRRMWPFDAWMCDMAD
ncbi:hypothetical protein FQN50_002550 [Emmonsiellopsis sp. PD_5]|nr:hypothetical protein FQN50_002550 [Emmonsiellopsis sp. PD_5]